MPDQADAQQLLKRIAERRRSLEVYLGSARPRVERLSLVSIISSALAAALTAGPALGGEGFTDSVAGAFNTGEDSTVWRVLCLLALVVSVISAIAVNLSKSRNWEARIISAEACNAELEGLQTLLEFGQIPVSEAVKLYQQYVAKVPFVGETPAHGLRATGRSSV